MAGGGVWSCFLGCGNVLRFKISGVMTDHQKEAFFGFLVVLFFSLLLGLLIQFL
jgi:hypothetical protein